MQIHTEDALAFILYQIFSYSKKASLSGVLKDAFAFLLALYAGEMGLSTPVLQLFIFLFQIFAKFPGQDLFFLDITQDARYNCCK